MSGLSEESKRYQNGKAEAERFGGAVFFVLALVGIGEFLESLKYKTLPLAKMGPGFFPATVGMLLFVASFAVLTRHLLGADKERVVPRYKDGNLVHSTRVRRFVLTALVIGYLLLYSTVGFLLCTAALVSGFMVAAGEKRITRAVLVGSAIALVAELVFSVGLKLYLPAGLFGINQLP